jgi:hypothetical protein
MHQDRVEIAEEIGAKRTFVDQEILLPRLPVQAGDQRLQFHNRTAFERPAEPCDRVLTQAENDRGDGLSPANLQAQRSWTRYGIARSGSI